VNRAAAEAEASAAEAADATKGMVHIKRRDQKLAPSSGAVARAADVLEDPTPGESAKIDDDWFQKREQRQQQEELTVQDREKHREIQRTKGQERRKKDSERSAKREQEKQTKRAADEKRRRDREESDKVDAEKRRKTRRIEKEARGPRTKGVLYKYNEKGDIINADAPEDDPWMKEKGRQRERQAKGDGKRDGGRGRRSREDKRDADGDDKGRRSRGRQGDKLSHEATLGAEDERFYRAPKAHKGSKDQAPAAAIGVSPSTVVDAELESKLLAEQARNKLKEARKERKKAKRTGGAGSGTEEVTIAGHLEVDVSAGGDALPASMSGVVVVDKQAGIEFESGLDDFMEVKSKQKARQEKKDAARQTDRQSTSTRADKKKSSASPSVGVADRSSSPPPTQVSSSSSPAPSPGPSSGDKRSEKKRKERVSSTSSTASNNAAAGGGFKPAPPAAWNSRNTSLTAVTGKTAGHEPIISDSETNETSIPAPEVEKEKSHYQESKHGKTTASEASERPRKGGRGPGSSAATLPVTSSPMEDSSMQVGSSMGLRSGAVSSGAIPVNAMSGVMAGSVMPGTTVSSVDHLTSMPPLAQTSAGQGFGPLFATQIMAHPDIIGPFGPLDRGSGLVANDAVGPSMVDVAPIEGAAHTHVDGVTADTTHSSTWNYQSLPYNTVMPGQAGVWGTPATGVRGHTGLPIGGGIGVIPGSIPPTVPGIYGDLLGAQWTQNNQPAAVVGEPGNPASAVDLNLGQSMSNANMGPLAGPWMQPHALGGLALDAGVGQQLQAQPQQLGHHSGHKQTDKQPTKKHDEDGPGIAQLEEGSATANATVDPNDKSGGRGRGGGRYSGRGRHSNKRGNSGGGKSSGKGSSGGRSRGDRGNDGSRGKRSGGRAAASRKDSSGGGGRDGSGKSSGGGGKGNNASGPNKSTGGSAAGKPSNTSSGGGRVSGHNSGGKPANPAGGSSTGADGGKGSSRGSRRGNKQFWSKKNERGGVAQEGKAHGDKQVYVKKSSGQGGMNGTRGETVPRAS